MFTQPLLSIGLFLACDCGSHNGYTELAPEGLQELIIMNKTAQELKTEKFRCISIDIRTGLKVRDEKYLLR
jgi:hypothetical protein